MFTKAKSFIRNIVSRAKAEKIEVLTVELVEVQDVATAVKTAKSRRNKAFAINMIANCIVSFSFGYAFMFILCLFPEIVLALCTLFAFIKCVDKIANFFATRDVNSTKAHHANMEVILSVFGGEAVSNVLNKKSKSSKEVAADDSVVAAA
ncbi:hypothetical protein KODAMA_02310 [Serratia phage vB_SmaM-Kodama]|nr:hypothetical protein KODAMA_02310 [Serratia phage vB_SmaM-Kodama]